MANLFTLERTKVSDLMGELKVRKNPALAEIIVSALKQQHAFTLVHGLFTSPQKQIEKVRAWNQEFGWGITDEAFVAAEKSVPAWPEEKLVAVVLVPYLADKANEDETVTTGLERTFHELWMRAKAEQDANSRWDGYDKAGPERLRLLKGIEHKPGLRWEVIDLGCNRNEKPMDVRNPEKSPHAGILAAAALHPEWIKAMDGENVPYVWAPGYEVNPKDPSYYDLDGVYVPYFLLSGGELRVFGKGPPWQSMPIVNFNRYHGDREIMLLCYRGTGEITLFCDWYGYYCSRCAVPSLVRE